MCRHSVWVSGVLWVCWVSTLCPPIGPVQLCPARNTLLLLHYGTQILTTLMLQYSGILGSRLGSRTLNLCPNTLSNCLIHDITQRPTHGNTHNEEKKLRIKNSSIMCQIAQYLDPTHIKKLNAKSSHIAVPLRV